MCAIEETSNKQLQSSYTVQVDMRSYDKIIKT